MEKHHYRNVYKSDHLGVADLEDLMEQGKSLIFTIKEVRQEMEKSVAGKKGDFNIAYFVETLKPWVLNAGNAKIIKGFAGGDPFVETWKNIPVELYIDDSVKMKGEMVGGVRVRPVQPIIGQKPKPVFTEENFEKAYLAKATPTTIKERYVLSPAMEIKYVEYVAAKE